MLTEYRTHAAQLLATTGRRLAQTRLCWALALAFATLITVALGVLTFSALSYILPLPTAVLSSLVLHLLAVMAVHMFYYHRSPVWRVPALIAWIAFSIIAFTIALYRGLMWFEGNAVAATALAAMEPFGIWVAGFVTAMAHLNMTKHDDYRRRSRETFDACSHNPRPERAWQRRLQQLREELLALEQPPALWDPPAEKERAAQHEHVLGYLRLMEGYANADDVDEDVAMVRAQPATALGQAIVEAAPRRVPFQPELVPEAEDEAVEHAQ